VEVVSEAIAETLPPHWSTDHAVDLHPGQAFQYGRISDLSEFESMTFKAYIYAHVANGLIQQPSLWVAALIQFAKKKDGGLRLCVEYCVLNNVTVQNPYTPPLIAQMLDLGRERRIYT